MRDGESREAVGTPEQSVKAGNRPYPGTDTVEGNEGGYIEKSYDVRDKFIRELLKGGDLGLHDASFSVHV